MEEIWKDIEGFEDLYQVSNFGRVWSIRKKKFIKLIKHNKNEQYLTLQLHKDKYIKCYQIHRLVYETFVRKLKQNECCHHKDHDPTNNRLDNLEAMNKSVHFSMHQKGIPKTDEHKRKIRENRLKNPREKDSITGRFIKHKYS